MLTVGVLDGAGGGARLVNVRAGCFAAVAMLLVACRPDGEAGPSDAGADAAVGPVPGAAGSFDAEVADALGGLTVGLPMTPERIWATLRASGT